MKRALALSIAIVLLPTAAAVAATRAPDAARYRLSSIATTPVVMAPQRYRVTPDTTAAPAAPRYRLTGAGVDKTTAVACGSGDALFATGFEN